MPLARRDILALGAVGATAAALGTLVGKRGFRSQGGAAALLSRPFTDLAGREVRLRDWPARVLLCNFWATWCAPCREEVPLLVAAWREFADNGLQIAGIGIDSAHKLQKFAEDYSIGYPILVASPADTDLLGSLGDASAALPFSLLLDSHRRVARRKLGAWNKDKLEKEIKAAFG